MEDYYWSGGQRVPLHRDPDVMALKFRPGPVGRTPLEPEALRILSERLEPAGFVGNRGIKLYRTAGDPRAVEVMARQPAVEFASPAYRRGPGGEELMFVTNQFLAQFKPEVTEAELAEINARHGVRVAGSLDYAPNAYTLEPEAGGDVVRLANVYREREPTLWSHPVLVRRRSKKGATLDVAAAPPPDGVEGTAPAASAGAASSPEPRPNAGRVVPADKRWHLGPSQTRVTEAWALPGLAADRARGSGAIKIAVLDDGCDTAHPEFVGRVVAQFDFEDGVADARPKRESDNHGTACTGVAAAAGVGPASGAAPGCSIIAVRTPSLLGVDEEARMFQWAADRGADVISCSWGPKDGEGTLDPMPDNVAAAVRYCVTRGRGGRGIPIFWAAGNGDESVSLDGYASCPDVIAVAASTSGDGKAWYSDHGPEIWICAPSSGDGDAGELSIFTTDRTGASGYNAGDADLGDGTGGYTGDFGGTSSATPLAAGIAGLLLSADPDLHENPASPRGREVRQILASTAAKIGTGYTNGHSPRFGFGRVDAAAAVREALRRRSDGQEGTDAPPRAVVDGPTRWARDAGPPTLRVDPGPGRFYAVEVAADGALFDADRRGPGPLPVDRFYATWDESALSRAPSYPAEWTMPDHAWEALRSAPRLFYRIWGSDQASAWVRAVASTGDADHASAPSMSLTDAQDDRGESGGKVSISAPAAVPRDGPAPAFLVAPGGGRHFAVEVATERGLLNHADVSAAPRRRPDAYFATWQTGGLLPAPSQPASWRLPADAWGRLRTAPALYYRAWASSRPDAWADVVSSSTDEEASSHAPCVRVEAGGASVRRAGAPGVGAGGGSRVRYPSGAELPVWEPGAMGDGIAHDPPPGVPSPAPLVSVAFRLDGPLCASFRVVDFASPLSDGDDGGAAGYAGCARIAPELVEALRGVVGRSGARVEVATGYLHPALAAERAERGGGGQGLEWHVAGLAADIRAGRPLDLARHVLHALGDGIGLGLLPDGVHVDLRRRRATWAEPGAELDGDAFSAWVDRVVAEADAAGASDWRGSGGGGSDGRARARAEMPVTAASFSVTGPDVHPAGTAEPPAFFVEFAGGQACRVEVATSPDLLGTEGGQAARSEVLRPSDVKDARVWRLPADAWAAMRGGTQLHYRAVGAAGADSGSSAPVARTRAGTVALSSGRSVRSKGKLQRHLPDPDQAASRDELRWRGGPTIE